jgi:hypothetical protein
LCRFKNSRRRRASRLRILTSHDGSKRILRAVLTSSRDGPARHSFQTVAMLSLLCSNATFSLSLLRALSYPRDIFTRHIRHANEDDHTRTKSIIPTKLPIVSNEHTLTPAYIHKHAHPHIHTHTHHEQGKRTSKLLPPQTPRVTNPPITPPPQALRGSTRPTNPNLHSPHQQTSLLPRVLSPSDQSTALLLSLSHSTSLRLSLTPTRRLF